MHHLHSLTRTGRFALGGRGAPHVMFEGHRFFRSTSLPEEMLDLRVVNRTHFCWIEKIRYRGFMAPQDKSLLVEGESIDDGASVVDRDKLSTAHIPPASMPINAEQEAQTQMLC